MYNVAVLPPAGICSKIEAISRTLGRYKPLFSLDGRTQFPHLTLYMARFEEARISDVANAIGRALLSQRPVQFNHTGSNATESGYTEASYEKTSGVAALHDTILHAVKGYRYKTAEPRRELYYGAFSTAQQSNVTETGYDLAGELYRPHITYAKFPDHDQAAAVLQFIPDEDLSFSLTGIGLFKADEFGACRSLVKGYSIN